jgi:hypothetical protein
MFETDLELYDLSRSRNRQVTLGPSAVGTCLRQSAYKAFGVPKTDERSRSRARLGTLLHLGYAQIAREQGRGAEVRIEIPGLGYGTADDVDYEARVVTDVKSASARAYERYVTQGIPDSYYDQAEIYAYGLWLQNPDDPEPWTVAVVLFNRESGDEARFEREADAREGAYLVDRLIARQEFLNQANRPEDIAREAAGPGTGFPCDYCDWMTECWGPPQGDLSPQAATIAEDEQAIEDVLMTYLSASAEAGKLEKAKKEARAFLTGIPPGQYGDAVLKWQGGNDLGEEPDPEGMMELIAMLGYDVPTRRKVSAKSVRVVRAKPGPAKTARTDRVEVGSSEPSRGSSAGPHGGEPPELPVADPGAPAS